MAHEVHFEVPARPLGNADIEFKIRKNGAKFGTLRISKGSIVWVDADHTYGHKLSWSDFAHVMNANGSNGHK